MKTVTFFQKDCKKTDLIVKDMIVDYVGWLKLIMVNIKLNKIGNTAKMMCKILEYLCNKAAYN